MWDHSNQDAKYDFFFTLKDQPFYLFYLKEITEELQTQPKIPFSMITAPKWPPSPTRNGDVRSFGFILYLQTRSSDQMQLSEALTSPFLLKGEMTFQLGWVAQKWTHW